MKLIGTADNQLELHFGRREKELLLNVLRLYPCVPPAHHKLSKSGALDASAQELLDQALAEQRSASQKQLADLLGESRRWTEHKPGWRLTLGTGEAEWLLQVLNDIRVGSWVSLGSPENHLKVLNEETAPHVWAMEVAGAFQAALLEILEQSA